MECDVKKPIVTLSSSEGIKQEPEDPVPSTKAVVKKSTTPVKPFKPPASSVPRYSAFLKPPFSRSSNYN